MASCRRCQPDNEVNRAGDLPAVAKGSRRVYTMHRRAIKPSSDAACRGRDQGAIRLDQSVKDVGNADGTVVSAKRSTMAEATTHHQPMRMNYLGESRSIPALTRCFAGIIFEAAFPSSFF